MQTTAILLFASSWLPPVGEAPVPVIDELGGPIAAAPVIAIAADGSTLLAWEESQGNERWIAFRRRTPGPDGRWTQEPARLDGAPAGTMALEPRLAIAGEGAILAWQDNRAGRTTAYMRRSTDLGKTWPFLETRLDEGAEREEGNESSSMIALAVVPSGRFAAAWESRGVGEREIRVRAGTEVGGTWSSRPVRLDVPRGASYHPQVTIFDAENLLAVWWDELNGLSDLFARRSGDGGVTWDAAVRLDPGAPGVAASRDAALASNGHTVALAWEDELGGLEREPLVCVSADAGRTWSEIVRLGRPRWASAIEDPRVAVDAAGRAHVFWIVEPSETIAVDDAGRRDLKTPERRPDPTVALFHAIIDSSGVRVAPALVPAAAPHARLTWVGSRGETTWAAWVGTRTDAGGVEAAATTDGGKSWRAVGLPRTQNPGGEFVPVIALTGAIDPKDGALHLAWSQGRTARERLRFARLPIPLARPQGRD